MKRTKTVKISETQMIIDDWEKAKDQACKAFARAWNPLMPCGANRVKPKDIERIVDEWLWDYRSDEVIR